MLQSWPAIIFAFFAGPLSEDYGRKPLMIIGLVSYIILNISFFINSWYMYSLGVSTYCVQRSAVPTQAEFLLFECLQDLFGGEIVFSLGAYGLPRLTPHSFHFPCPAAHRTSLTRLSSSLCYARHLPLGSLP
jgi:MFS family permease